MTTPVFGSRTQTWRLFAQMLTPQQLAICERSDANPNHPSGTAEGHRRGMVRVALTYALDGANLN